MESIWTNPILRAELFRKWYPHSPAPVHDEIIRTMHLAPVTAVQVIFRRRWIDSGGLIEQRDYSHSLDSQA